MIVKTLQKILIASMFVIPVAGFIVTPNDYVIKGENRNINRFPSFGDKAFFAQLVNFYNDRLLFKLPVTENIYKPFKEFFKDFDFNNSQFTVPGIKGWLFIGNSADSVYSQHCEDLKFSERMFVKKMALLDAIKTVHKGQFYFVTGPDKHGIYPEYMDPYIREPGKYRFFDKVKPYLESHGIDVIDNYDVLRSRKDKSEKISLYFTDDTHWNRYGAKIAFDNVMGKIFADYSPIRYKFSFSKHKNGDLIRNISNPNKDILDDATIVDFPAQMVKVTDISSGNSRTTAFEPNNIQPFGSIYANPSGISDKTLMLVTDSYGIFFTPYAVNYFKKVIHMHRQISDPNEILATVIKEKPEVIIFLNVERSVRD